MKPRISVIIPVYNVEQYFPRCLQSVEEQTMREGIEYILVDDGSKDSSGRLCDEFARKHPEVRVIHKENGGLSSARNAALDIAEGEYFAFLDSDDFVRRDTYERLDRAARESGADIVSFASLRVRGDEEVVVPPEGEPILMTKPSEYFHRMLYGRYCSSSVCSKLFRRELFDGLRFPVGVVCEDTFVIPTIFLRAKSIFVLQERLFYYRQRPDSIMHTLGSAFPDYRLRAHEEIARVIRAHVPELAPRMPTHMMNVRMRCLREIMLHPRLRKHPCWKSHIRAFRKLVPEILRTKPCKGFSTRHKISALLLAYCPDIMHLYIRVSRRNSLKDYSLADNG